MTKKPPNKAIQRWDTEGGASKNGPQQEPRKKRPRDADSWNRRTSRDCALRCPPICASLRLSFTLPDGERARCAL